MAFVLHRGHVARYVHVSKAGKAPDEIVVAQEEMAIHVLPPLTVSDMVFKVLASIGIALTWRTTWASKYAHIYLAV